MFPRLQRATTQEENHDEARGFGGIVLATSGHYNMVNGFPVAFASYALESIQELRKSKTTRLLEAIKSGEASSVYNLLNSNPNFLVTKEILVTAIGSFNLEIVKYVLVNQPKGHVEKLVNDEILQYVISIRAVGLLLEQPLEIFKHLLSVTSAVSENILLTLIQSVSGGERFNNIYNAILRANVPITEQSLLLAINKKHSVALQLLWPMFSYGELTALLCAQLADKAKLPIDQLKFIPETLVHQSNFGSSSNYYCHFFRLMLEGEKIYEKIITCKSLIKAKYESIKYGQPNYLGRIDDLLLLYIAESIPPTSLNSGEIMPGLAAAIGKSCIDSGFFPVPADGHANSGRETVYSSLVHHGAGRY
jgi:hypothetical protein